MKSNKQKKYRYVICNVEIPKKNDQFQLQNQLIAIIFIRNIIKGSLYTMLLVLNDKNQNGLILVW